MNVSNLVGSLAILLVMIGFSVSCLADEPVMKALVIDGQNNHKWKQTTPLIKSTLESTGRFTVDVATSPAKGGDMSQFKPKFSDYDVVVSNYNGGSWSEETQQAFASYVKSGGGFVSVHAADNSFPNWLEYNQMIGVGGWGGRNEKSGPYVRWRDGKFARDTQAGRGGSHGRRHAFEVVVRDPSHPITRGIPTSWLQAEDELYAELRGPATNMDVLATAFSDKSTNGTGEHEPILMVISFGKGRVFHTTMGHDANSMSGAAFQITLQRGAEWAATGDVTQPAVTAAQLSNKDVVKRNPEELELPIGHGKVDFSAAPDPDGEGWTAIFDGKTLDGWTQRNGTAKYSVDGDAILGVTNEGSPNSFLCSDKDYADFELTFEVKVHNKLNSGVQIRSKSLKDYNNFRVHGPQVEIEAGPAEAGYVYAEATGRGWLSPTQPKTDAIKNGEWNRYLVRAVGPRIQTWINGRKIEDIYDETSYQEGFLGLQVHGIGRQAGPFDVRWRDIK
ncbi:MAG: family 16 glycoside hydrolase, partial [Planctomycetota bacterium]